VVAEKVGAGAKSVPQALKRGHILNDLTARLKSCLSQTVADGSFSASCELVPFPQHARTEVLS